jgi:hypothetical protein
MWLLQPGAPMGPVKGLMRNALLQNLELRGSHKISFARGEMRMVDITWELQNQMRQPEAVCLIDGNADPQRVMN